MKFIIHAPNVHQGGGKTLLLSLLQSVDLGTECVLIADMRLDKQSIPPHVQVKVFAPTIAGRFTAEKCLKALAVTEDLVLCMGNLPPLLTCAGRVAVFLQNRFLCDTALSLRNLAPKTRLRIAVERLWLRRRLQPGMRLLVQTASMQQAARMTLGTEATIAPFIAQHGSATPRQSGNQRPAFVYPASADPHKNHAALLAAWLILKESGVEADLHLTVSQTAPFLPEIEKLRLAGVPIINHGELEPHRLAGLYLSASALIFPSNTESFGLPLLEAQAMDLPIVAAERDYVRDVVEPAETFDPDSPVSIARAVRRFLGAAEKPASPMSPREFIQQIIAHRD